MNLCRTFANIFRKRKTCRDLQIFLTGPRTAAQVLRRGGPVPRAAAGRRPAAGGRAPRPPVLLRGPVYPALSRLSCLLLSKIGKFAKFANLWRARSQLYKNEILQENMRLIAFFKLYKMCTLLDRCDLKI